MGKENLKQYEGILTGLLSDEKVILATIKDGESEYFFNYNYDAAVEWLRVRGFDELGYQLDANGNRIPKKETCPQCGQVYSKFILGEMKEGDRVKIHTDTKALESCQTGTITSIHDPFPWMYDFTEITVCCKNSLHVFPYSAAYRYFEPITEVGNE
jgi:hypothetical protein